MASTLALPMPAPQLALSEHRTLRVTTLFLLYIAQGLPLGLINFALPGWLAQNGASAAAIGALLAMANLPWTFKLAYGVVMDRYAFLAMGRRRPWIIAGQLGMIGTFAVMAVMNPDAADIALVTAFAFALGMGSAIQDVAVDGLAADILPENEIERVNGVMFGGQMAGIAVGTGLGGTLIAYQGVPTAALALAAILVMILALVVAVRERAGERLLPWTEGHATQRNLDIHLGALWPIIRNVFAAMSQRQILFLMLAFVTALSAPGILNGVKPMFATDVLGWQKDTFTTWSSQAQLLAGLPTALVFGFVAARRGARQAFIFAALMTGLCALVMLALQSQWASPTVFIAFIFATEIVRAMRLVAGGALAMRLCTPAIAATQFAVFMAVFNLGSVLGGLMLGWLDGIGGIPAMLTAAALLSFVAAGLALTAKVGR
ncbi:MAG: MFS transporter [Sphingopyxis sp.]|nr:MFS transporter [Sphingopyxis sp.]